MEMSVVINDSTKTVKVGDSNDILTTCVSNSDTKYVDIITSIEKCNDDAKEKKTTLHFSSKRSSSYEKFETAAYCKKHKTAQLFDLVSGSDNHNEENEKLDISSYDEIASEVHNQSGKVSDENTIAKCLEEMMTELKADDILYSMATHQHKATMTDTTLFVFLNRHCCR